MTLGPGRLDQSGIRSILRQPQFKKLIQQFKDGGIEWDDKILASLKLLIRLELRSQQDGRCIYCKRPLKIERRNAYEDIEHFLDKSKPRYRNWAFCCTNLTLACHACNLEKGMKNLGIGLVTPGGVVRYRFGPGMFIWIHPFYDSYHDNIEVGRGWTYKVKANAPYPELAKKLVDDLKLVDIEEIERRAEETKNRVRELTVMAARCVKKRRIKSAEIVLAASLKLQESTTYG